MAGLAELSCVVEERDLSPDDRLALQLIENALRSDLRPLEQANAYRALMAAKGWSTRQLGAELAIHATTITKALALLDLPVEVQQRVEQGGLSPAAAYEVSKLEDPAAQAELAQTAIAEGLTRSDVAEAVKAIRARRAAPEARPDPVTFEFGDVAVKVTWKKGGSLTTTQALRRALKEAQERERKGEVEAA
jgi:ParB family chromosome partitioning protein